MEIISAKERVFLIKEQLTKEQIRERAWDQKTNVFGGISKLVFRPKSEDVQVGYSEMRYEPFWHVTYRTTYTYAHKHKYSVPVSSQSVKSVTIEGMEYTVDDHNRINLTCIEKCEEINDHELFVDGLTGEKRLWKHYLSFPNEEISDLPALSVEHAIIVPPEMRSSYVVRQLLTGALKAAQADEVFEDRVEITNLNLYLRPIYAYEYTWQSRGRTAIAEFDGLTGEIRTNGKTTHDQIGKIITPDLLFDISSEAANLILPGSAIAIRVVKALSTKEASRAD